MLGKKLDRKTFENQMAAFPSDRRALFAVRAGIRTYPLAGSSFELEASNATKFLLDSRKILTAVVAVRFATQELIETAFDARSRFQSTVYFGQPKPKAKAHIRLTNFASINIQNAGNIASGHTDDPNTIVDGILSDEASNTEFGEAAIRDIEIKSEQLFAEPIWHDRREPEGLIATLAQYTNLLNNGPTWSFWREWYQGFLDGKPLDWELQKEIALIPDADWEKGPEWIAELIEEIRKKYDNVGSVKEPRQPDFEPDSVETLLANSGTAVATTVRLSNDISDAFARFHAETGANEIPDTFRPLQAIPISLVRITGLLKVGGQTPENEVKLREEIGRLNAKVALLEQELITAKSAQGGSFGADWKKQMATSLGDWKLYAALAASVWIVSGDDLGVRKRLQNIIELRDELFGEECPQPVPGLPSFDSPLAET